MSKYEAKREDWMPDLSNMINYGDPANDEFRGGHEGELNPNYRHGGRCGTEENKKAYHKEYYKKYYQEHKDEYRARYENNK